ncbi:MAG: response regulator transcription factor [Spirochaetaceae bacterium]|jgi:DNA-binding NarL/FixJ family response regulator|nr:response regulator transcription factor [Spirochaetaceae bacterium]
MIKIIIINKHEAERNHIKRILTSQENIEIIGQGKDDYDALTLVASRKPAIAVMDAGSIDADGVQIIPMLYAKSPATAVILHAPLADKKQIYKAIRHDVRGFVLKTDTPDSLIAAVKKVHQGGRFTSPTVRDKTYSLCAELLKNAETSKKNPAVPAKTRKASALSDISSIELRIMVCITRGNSTEEIAKRFNLANGTVRNYLSSGMKKAGLRNRMEVPIFIIRHGLIRLNV